MKFRFFVPLCLFAVTCTSADAAGRPNIVIFLSDDHTARDSSVYGSEEMATPNMARLAAAGMTFDNAFVASPSCAPSRAAMLTGLYPQHSGAEPNHSRPHAEIKKLPAYLQELGYEVVSFGKVGHYKQTPDYGFDLARHFGYHEDIAVPKALEWLKNRKSDKPLCLFVGTNWPHVPWPEDVEKIDIEKLRIPPHHVTTPKTRQFRARYAAAVATMDRELGEVYDLAREKLGEGTFFLHTSDHGAQWPFGKWNLYDDGIRTPLIVSWSGEVDAGVRSDAMVSWIDILPTLVEVAGGGLEGVELDGRSFLPVLRDGAKAHRERIFTTHSADGDKNVFPIRSVRTGDGWKYIRNLHPEFRFSSHVTKARPEEYWNSWLAKAKTNPDAESKVRRYQERPAEELYFVDDDPYEQRNLAGDPGQAKRLDALRADLDGWLKEMGDTATVFGNPELLKDE